MTVKLLTEHHLEFLSLTRGCTGSSESTLVKMPQFWKSHVAAQYILIKMAGEWRFNPSVHRAKVRARVLPVCDDGYLAG